LACAILFPSPASYSFSFTCYFPLRASFSKLNNTACNHPISMLCMRESVHAQTALAPSPVVILFTGHHCPTVVQFSCFFFLGSPSDSLGSALCHSSGTMMLLCNGVSLWSLVVGIDFSWVGYWTSSHTRVFTMCFL